MESQPIKIEPVVAFLPLFTEKRRYVFAWGGRGGAKSISFADILLLKGRQEKLRILCCREIQKSIEDSVHTLLSDRIEHHGFNDYEIIKTHIRNKYTGTEFIFTGLREHNVSSIKSYQGINYVWVEEAQSVTPKSLDILTPTIREADSEIWFSYNRIYLSDPVHKLAMRELGDGKEKTWQYTDKKKVKWIEYRGSDAIGIYINYDGNRYFPDVLRREMEKDKEENESIYRHKWLGYPQPEGGDTLIGQDRVIDAVNRKVKPWDKLSIGVDPARYGDDESVICYRVGYQIMPLQTFRGINTMQLSGMVINLAKELYKTNKTTITVKIDDTGIGGGVTDRLKELSEDENRKGDKKEYSILVIPVVNNGTATIQDYYDYGAEMWGEMSKALKAIAIPNDDILISQLTGRKYRIHSDGRIKLEKKDDMKKRGLTSPDRADALALCLATIGEINFSDLSFEVKKM